ncbi:MAG: NAD(P)-dependent oxidoreductase [Planctomycetes bacterium]|nr:NAD(P)-dependent oxidoreductase [Planctomycetota bacterium]
MPSFSRPPSTEEELEEVLTQPTPGTIEAMRDLGGDLMILGAGGKMGPTMAALAVRSIAAAGKKHRVICVSRFGASSKKHVETLHGIGAETISADLLERDSLAKLPDVPNIMYLAGMKFGTEGAPSMTWAMNVFVPAIVAERFTKARIVALSTGNVYPFVPVRSGGATEEVTPGPIGDYANSCLGRERMFEYMATRHGTKSVLVRLNYANDLRYGVLLDIANKVKAQQPIDLAMGYANSIWQGDANAVCLRSFPLAANPAAYLNLTGPELVSIRDLALRVAKGLGLPAPTFVGKESENALLNNAAKCHTLFGKPDMSIDTLIDWTIHWVKVGGATLNKPSHFEVRDGKF